MQRSPEQVKKLRTKTACCALHRSVEASVSALGMTVVQLRPIVVDVSWAQSLGLNDAMSIT